MFSVVGSSQGSLVERMSFVHSIGSDEPLAIIGGAVTAWLGEPASFERHPASAGPAVGEKLPAEGETSQDMAIAPLQQTLVETFGRPPPEHDTRCSLGWWISLVLRAEASRPLWW